MKLQSRYNRAAITATIIVLMLGSIGDYFILRYVLLTQIDNSLIVEEQEINDYVKEKNAVPQPTNYWHQLISFANASAPIERRFTNQEIYDPEEKESENFRVLLFTIKVNGKYYTAKVAKPLAESEDLVLLILFLTGIVILLLLTLLYVANRIYLKKIWKPFYYSLQEMKAFNLTRDHKMVFNDTRINEFNDLNSALDEMMLRVGSEYNTLKSFTENASHEMQTPLAIITSKLDLLIQSPELSEVNTGRIHHIYDAVTRLSRLNQSLLLLTKIGNNYFIEKQEIQVDKLLEEKIVQYEELFHANEIKLSSRLSSLKINAHPVLSDILLSNLFINSIAHTPRNGEIIAKIEGKILYISNTSPNGPLDPSRIFSRFEKGKSSEGLGLGLAIAKEICESSGFTLEYSHEAGMHIFSVNFATGD